MLIDVGSGIQTEQRSDSGCLSPVAVGAGDGVTAKLSVKAWNKAEFQIGVFGARLIARPNARYLPSGLAPDFTDGMTGVVFTLGKDGRAHDCAIGLSSGIGLLDSAACALIVAHVISTPATRNGVPVASSVRLTVRWHRGDQGVDQQACSSGDAIPISSPNVLPFWAFRGWADARGKDVRIKLDLSLTGVPERCTVMEATASKPLQHQTCVLAIQTLRYLPPIDANGNFIASTMQVNIRFR